MATKRSAGHNERMGPSSFPRHLFLFIAVLSCLISIPTLNVFHEPPVLIFFGGILVTVIHGAAAILTVELVWGPGPFWRRLSIYGIWVACGTTALLMPLMMDADGYFWRNTAWNLGILPLVSLSSQLPLWMMRFLGRFRLVRDDLPAPGKEIWTLRDFGLGTVLLAAALAGIRVTDFNEWEWIIPALAACMVPVIFALPASLYVLLRQGMKYTLADAAVHYAVVMLIAMLILGLAGALREMEVIIVVLWPIACLLAGPVVGFLILRHGGWRLVIGDSSSPRPTAVVDDS